MTPVLVVFAKKHMTKHKTNKKSLSSALVVERKNVSENVSVKLLEYYRFEVITESDPRSKYFIKSFKVRKCMRG